MALFWRRIHCHFCGTRSPHPRGSAISSFHCDSCDAVNYLDSKGIITDPPSTIATVAQSSRPTFETFSRGLGDTRAHQQQQVFCNTCQHNQQIYNETLANYLPDEDHPQYAQFEKRLPVFRKELEARYPQICTACAPRAQLKINRADHYGLTDNLAKQHARARPRRGASPGAGEVVTSRDDGFKQVTRTCLRAAGMAVWASIAVQLVWHAYVVCVLLLSRESHARFFASEPTVLECAKNAGRLRFDVSCEIRLETYVPHAIITALLLVWYNHGLRALCHPVVRYESVDGRGMHLALSVVGLIARVVAFRILTKPATNLEWSWAELVGAHSFAIFFMLAGRRLSRQAIKPRQWRINRHIMPKPDEVDVLGQYAGPATEQYTPEAASSLPFTWSGQKPKRPFPIDSLAPKRQSYNTAWASPSNHFPPSPPASEDTFADADAMDIDPVTPSRSLSRFSQATSQLRPTAANPGWEDMRSNLFSIDDALRTEQTAHQKLTYQPPTAKSPFQGRLPAAPMSMERRLRNPISQVPSFREPHVSQQQGFLEKMREGIEVNRPFLRPQAGSQTPRPSKSSIEDSLDSDFSPAASRTRGNLDLKPSSWHLPQDTEGQATGLEDLLGGPSFRISESAVLPAAMVGEDGGVNWWTVGSLGAGLGLLGTIAGVGPVRRWVCLGIVEGMEKIGL